MNEQAPGRRDRTDLATRSPGDGVRFAEFDALRGTAIVLVVTLHSALAYTRFDIPRLLWGVREPSGHVGLDLFCWWSMGVSVPLFFAISGFFAAAVEGARGPSEFLKGRFRRVVVPALASGPILLPLCFFAWSLGWLSTDRCTVNEFRRMRFLDPRIMGELYGPAHLWFLEYLIPMFGAFWAIRARDKSRRPALPGGWLLRWWSPMALAVPAAVLLMASREISGIDAGLDRHNSFIPGPIRLVYYGMFFAFGVGAHRDRGRLDALIGRGWWYLAASVPVFGVRAWLLPLDWSRPLAEPWSLVMAASGGLFTWLTLFGLIGVYRRHLAGPSEMARYLAGASFWLYLVHLPIVGLVQLDLLRVAIPTVAKFGLVWGFTMGLGLASYHVFVRRTALGRFLGSRGPAAVVEGRADRAGGAIRPSRPEPRIGRSARQRRQPA